VEETSSVFVTEIVTKLVVDVTIVEVDAADTIIGS
jgi:hypothetical protein